MHRHSLYSLAHLETPPTLSIHSMEGDLYTAQCELANGELALVCSDDGAPLQTRSLEKMRNRMQGLTFSSVYLVQRTPYDEMIGTDTHSEPVKTRLNWG